MKNNDYYRTLGIARDAAAEEIQRAFRKAARSAHPDVCKEADAEERFKEINEAYSVLSDSEKRSLYDRWGENWEQMRDHEGPQPGHKRPGGGRTGSWESFRSFDENSQAQSGFYYHGGAGEAGGINDFFQDLFGGQPGGSSRFTAPPEDMQGRDISAELAVSLDDLIAQRSQTIRIKSEISPGYNSAGQDRKIAVKIPAGVTDGSIIRLKGQGEPGRGSGPAGDLLLKITVLRDHRFTVNGYDLESAVTVSPWEAALGAQIDVETSGKMVRLSIPPGTGNNKRFRLRGKGLAKKNGSGDLYVRIQIDIPRTLSTREKDLFTELSRVSSYRPRSRSDDDTDMDQAA